MTVKSLMNCDIILKRKSLNLSLLPAEYLNITEIIAILIWVHVLLSKPNKNQ